jgi:23S rRNA (cytidine1920-2'-O)/16S rRNA (cytidine1409-2'-O)-methyltransferase
VKERIDVLLVQRGLVPSREKAQAFLMAGSVLVDGTVEWKPGTRVDVDADIALKEDPVPYVSRGGLKLAAALDAWDIDLAGVVCADIGASTGGFTDVMLKRGAARVYAIDVGYGQLDFSLRNDSRVVNLERQNVRYLPEDAVPEPCGFVSIDVSFISLKLVLPTAARICNNRLVALVKPQFEAGRAQVGKGGIVRDPAVHAEVVAKVQGYSEENGLVCRGVMDSPITGAKGNQEFLLLLEKK